MRVALLTPPYLILLRAEFGCFHSSSSLEGSRSRLPDRCPGHSLCSTVPHLTVEGCYPLRSPAESGLSSLDRRITPPSRAIALKTIDETFTGKGVRVASFDTLGSFFYQNFEWVPL